MSRAAAKTLASSSIGGSSALRRLIGVVLADAPLAAEERLLARLAVEAPVAQLVADREAAARGPLLALGGVDPDLALAGEEEAGEGLVGGELGGAGGGGQVGDVADQEADVVVGDVLDRDREALAVPDVVGDLGEEGLGSVLELLRRHRHP